MNRKTIHCEACGREETRHDETDLCPTPKDRCGCSYSKNRDPAELVVEIDGDEEGRFRLYPKKYFCAFERKVAEVIWGDWDARDEVQLRAVIRALLDEGSCGYEDGILTLQTP